MAKERDERNFYQMERDRIDTFWEVTRKELEETRAEVIKYFLVMIIVPSKTGEHYAAVKNICCVESAVPSQVTKLVVLLY